LEYEEFESDLGDIAISKRHIEREESENHWIEERKERLGGEKLVENVDFARVKDIEYEIGSVLNSINLKVDGEWKKLYFVSEETAQEVFDTLEYRLKAFKQKYD
jgi:hypothetical protein